MSYLTEIVDNNQQVNPLFRMLGIRVAVLDPGRCELVLPFSDGLVQGAGVIAGGIISTLLDEAMAHALMATLYQTGRPINCATADLYVRYLAPAKRGAALTATATVVKQGRSLFFLEGEATDGEQVVAKGAATFLAKN